MRYHVVLDTNVLVAALMSRRGKAYALLSCLGDGSFDLFVSVAVVLEYEEVLKRLLGTKIILTEQDVDTVLDYLCSVARHQAIYYLWQPFLPDPKDDMVLELAVSGQCHAIVTYNADDFEGCEQFGIEALTPAEFLTRLGATP